MTGQNGTASANRPTFKKSSMSRGFRRTRIEAPVNRNFITASYAEWVRLPAGAIRPVSA